jgi:hypothetical protein
MGPALGPIVISALAFACGSSDPPVAAPADAAVSSDAPLDAADDGADAEWPWAGKEEAGHSADHSMPAPYPRPVYVHLAETGLFSDPASGALAANLLPFSPNYVLWSDGAEKRRWILLPGDAQIDTQDMDHWVFPIGTKFWKEFSRGGVKLETRLIERYGPGRDDFWMGAFVWNAEQTDAVFVENGQPDLLGTTHDAPAQKQCWSCHQGEPGRGLGFSALQLAGTGPGMRLADLVSADVLTQRPTRTDFHAPGEPAVAAALGYLHANCGHCHNRNGTSWPDTQMDLRLVFDDFSPPMTGAYRTTIGQPLSSYRNSMFPARVVAHDPAKSALMFRMKARGSKDQMPSLATEMIDPVGVEVVQKWIESLQ